MRKVKFCAFCCGSRFGDSFLVECNVGGEGEQRNRKGTVKEYENHDKLGVGIGRNFGHEKGEILCVFLRISFW